MNWSLGGFVSAGAICLTASITFAGTPLPNPPFSSGGFVPPDSIAFKQEANVGKLLTKYALGLVKCDQSTLIALQLAYEPANMQKVPDVQAKWTACEGAVLSKYQIGRDKLLLGGTPTCLDQAGIDAIRAQIDAQVLLLRPRVFCDGDAAAPDPITGLNIPDFKNVANGEAAAAKVVTKAGTLAGKCYVLALKYAFQFAGLIPPEQLGRVTACLTKAGIVGDTAMETLDQTQKLPSCLPLAAAEQLVSETIAVAGQFTDDTDCASPSGAFVE